MLRISICNIFLLFGIGACAQVNLDSMLVAHFPFNGNAVDISGNQNHGTVLGPVLTEDRSGFPNSAYYFDGVDDQIKLEQYQNMSPTDAVSIVAWVQTESSAGAPPIYDRLNTNDGYGLRLDHSGNLRLTINGGIEDAISDREVNDGIWHCVVGTYDKDIGELNVFIDSEWWGNDFYSATITYSPEPRNSIGGIGGTIPVFFNGKIDDVRIYNRAINFQEISSLCQVKGIPTAIIEENQKSVDFLVFPNPADEYFEIQFEHGKFPEKIVLLNDLGIPVPSQLNQTPSGFRMYIEDKSRGKYFIQARWNDGKTIAKKVIIY